MSARCGQYGHPGHAQIGLNVERIMALQVTVVPGGPFGLQERAPKGAKTPGWAAYQGEQR